MLLLSRSARNVDNICLGSTSSSIFDFSRNVGKSEIVRYRTFIPRIGPFFPPLTEYKRSGVSTQSYTALAGIYGHRLEADGTD